jgi:hypothetical protein
MTIGLLQALRIAYVVAAVAAPAGAVLLGKKLVKARRRSERRPGLARWLLLCATTTFGLVLMEAAAGAWQVLSRRVPSLPTAFPDGPAGASRDDVVDIVVIGESSAEGQPYHPRFSVGRVIAWQLGRVFPGREFRVEVKAAGGICLEQAILALQVQGRRPDILLIYAGHNEFQARYGWSRAVRYYHDELLRPGRRLFVEWSRQLSPVCDLIEETIEKHRLDEGPPPHVTRELVDHPAFKPAEYAYLKDDFDRRLDGVVGYARRIGALPILIIPPGNDAGFPPYRSYLAPETTRAGREAFARDFRAAREAEAANAARAEAAYRALLARQPLFAEAHYRLARLLDRSGRRGEAGRHYALARDRDGMPMRCPGDFQAAYRAAASRHSVVLVDGPAVLRRRSPSGLLDDHLFHDAQHPTLESYVALAQDALDQLGARRALGWPEGVATPTIDPVECAAHFGIDAASWSEVCERTATFYARTAYMRHDPSESLQRADRYASAARQIDAGQAPASVGIPGIGISGRESDGHPASTLEEAVSMPAGTRR